MPWAREPKPNSQYFEGGGRPRAVSLEATPTAPDRPDPTDPERAADWGSVGSFKLLARFGLAFAGYADAFANV